MKINEIIDELYKYQSQHIKDFSKSLVPGSKQMIGVKVPNLRMIAKRIAKEDPIAFLENNNFSYYELEMLQAMVIGYMKLDINTTLGYVKKFIPLIHDWSVNDCFCQTFKIANHFQDTVWDFLMKYQKSSSEFELRVLVVMLMTYFLNDKYIDQVIEIVDNIKHNGYYYKMGAAWLIATIMVKYPDKCLKYLKNNNLDDWTFNKAIQKMIESFRVSDEIKEEIRLMKR